MTVLSPPLAIPPWPAPAARKSRVAPLRFTLDGDPALESSLGRSCAAITAGIRGLVPAHRLEAVLLGGGYGRGEGGVLRHDGGDHPYNDLEFYVCLRGNRHLNERRHHRALAVLGEILTPAAGADIDFKITSLRELRRSPVNMFTYDLVTRHRRLLGETGLLLNFRQHRIARDIPSAEATRLLLNRCSGLLFAQGRLERAEFTADDADFVQRNLAKAELGFGDAVLTAHRLYHWSGRERQRRLQRLIPAAPLSWLEEVRARHAAAVGFKYHPVRSTASRADLQAQQSAVVALGLKVWLWQEGRRLGAGFPTAASYSGNELDKCPETNRWRNVLVNLKVGGPAAWLRHSPFRHPRDPVLRTLCRLLWQPAGARASSAAGFASLVAAYREAWQKVN